MDDAKRPRRRWPITVAAALMFTSIGCVEQTMTVQSTPPGALVYMNDQEIGRTPLTRDFQRYGDYDVQVRLDGYQTLQTHSKVSPPYWNWVPFDLVAYLLPVTFKDHKSLQYTLKPLDPVLDDPAELVQRGESLRQGLESSPFTRVPTPRAATRSTSRPTSRPAS